MSRNNQNFKKIRHALELTNDDVVNVCALGGMEIGKDRATRWARAASAGSGRYSVMSNAEFDAFCAGLPAWTAGDGD